MQPEEGKPTDQSPEDSNYWETPSPRDEASFQSGPEPAPAPEPIAPLLEWEASEFIEHDKSPFWYVIYVSIALVVVGLSMFVLKDWFATIAFAITFFTFGFFAARKPRTLHYELDEVGLHIGERSYAYSSFHAFGVVQEDNIYSVVLLPNARFSPTLTIYFTQDLGEQIVDILSHYLPMQEITPDWMSRFTKKIRF